MKRITPGRVVKTEIWWKGYKAECTECGERIELEGNEVPGKDFAVINVLAHVTCPNETCGKLIVVVRDDRAAAPEGPKTFIWNASPEPGVSYQTHKFTLVDAIESFSQILETDYTAETETVIAGRDGRSVLASLPHLIEQPRGEDGLMPVKDGLGLIGKIGHREVLFDKSLEQNFIVVRNNKSKKQVIIKIEEHPGKGPFGINVSERGSHYADLYDDLAKSPIFDALFGGEA